MPKSSMPSGTKLDISFTDENGQQINLKSTFEKDVDTVSILISRPLHQGKPIEIDENTKLTIVGGQNMVQTIVGYVDAVTKIGPRTYWRVRKVDSKSVVNQRSDARVRAVLTLEVFKTYWGTEGIDSTETCPALSIDISNGGIAFYINAPFSTGEIIELQLPKYKRLHPFSLRGEVCWMRDAEKGSSFRHIIGVRFILDSKTERDRVVRYVSALMPN